MKQLLILSGKGGTGKTTVAGAFIRLAQAKAYADCDVDAPNLHLIMNHTREPKVGDYFGLPKATIDTDKCIRCDLCRQSCRFNAIELDENYHVNYYSCEGCGVCKFVCPSDAITLSPNKAGDLMLYKEDDVFSTAQLKMGNGTSGLLVTEVKKQLKENAPPVEYAIIDGSPGIGCPVIASITGVDMVLVVAEPSISGIQDMERIVATTQRFGIKIGICVNKHDTNPEKTQQIMEYCETKELAFLGTIPYDPQAVEAINQGKTLVDQPCPSGEAVKILFDNTLKSLNS
jgi:MinD superfamily P-loop ATPase